MSIVQPLRFDVPVHLFDGPYTLDLKGDQRETSRPTAGVPDGENSDNFPIVIVQNRAEELRAWCGGTRAVLSHPSRQAR